MRHLLVLVSVLSLLACTALGDRQRDSKLDDALSDYASAIRWGDFRRADDLRRLADPGQTSPSPDSLADVRVTSYRVIDTVKTASGDAADLDVSISFYIDESMSVRTLRDHQHWSYDAPTSRWYITTPLPDFRSTR